MGLADEAIPRSTHASSPYLHWRSWPFRNHALADLIGCHPQISPIYETDFIRDSGCFYGDTSDLTKPV